MKPRVAILKADGTNCDEETAFAFQKAGADPRVVLVNELRQDKDRLSEYQIAAIPGGFSYGDDVASGRIFAVELLSTLAEQLQQFVNDGKPIIGICNGFQVLVRTGLLPHGELGNVEVALAGNESGRFHCTWVDTQVQPSPCIFTQGLEGEVISLQMAHGEGRVYCHGLELDKILAGSLVALKYLDNPNGSIADIAGLTDPTGRIFGLMPHPERLVQVQQHPNWRRQKIQPMGLKMFENAVSYARGNL